MASSSLIRRALSALITKDATVRIPHRVRTPEVKASSVGLLPRGAYGAAYEFFSPDGGNTIIEIDGHEVVGPTAIAFLSYWYAALRWKGQKLAEAPLMVVEEDQDDGSEEWLPDHELVDILDMPSPDYDMGELIERTSHYLDNTGAALWVFDKDNAGRIGRITPFRRSEFTVTSDDQRLFAKFTIQTKNGPVDKTPEQVAYFRDMIDTNNWTTGGRSRLDTAMSWLRLGAKAQATIHDLLANSVWPSAVIIPDKDWNPDPKMLREYKQDVEDYGKRGNKGKPFIQVGGGTFNELSASIKDLVPEEILNRVETAVSSISGIPAIVLQFQVGMENSPWSQMAQARRMAYDDTIIPGWDRFERVLTRQMLRPVDEDTTHFLRFDISKISSLAADQMTQVTIATTMGKAASLNERRQIMGLEPSKDPKADEIPELTQPSLQDILAAQGGNQSTDGETQTEDAAQKKAAADAASRRKTIERKLQAPALQQVFREESETVWTHTVSGLLAKDGDHIAQLVNDLLLDEHSKSRNRRIEKKVRGKDRVMEAVTGYLNGASKASWARATTPLMVKAMERSTAVVSADMGIGFNVLHPGLASYAKKNTATMITSVSGTTKKLVSDIIQGGLDEGASTSAIAQLIRDATGFSKARAQTIARTETTKAFNGAPDQSLAALSESTGRIFTKTWSGVLDEKERDEHVAMEGETVQVGEVFSNGLEFPSEPNCRCTVLFDEVDA